MMENMILELSGPGHGRRKFSMEPILPLDFKEYSHKFEQIIRDYEQRILDAILLSGEVMFKSLVNGLEPIEIARYFIALLYLATKEKISLQHSEEPEDIKIISR
jgi:segregation and condensation protein A